MMGFKIESVNYEKMRNMPATINSKSSSLSAQFDCPSEFLSGLLCHRSEFSIFTDYTEGNI